MQTKAVKITPNPHMLPGSARRLLFEIFHGGPIVENPDGTLDVQLTDHELSQVRMRGAMHKIEVDEPAVEKPATPEETIARLNEQIGLLLGDSKSSVEELGQWREAAGVDHPAQLREVLAEQTNLLGEWRDVTGCESPEEFAAKLQSGELGNPLPIFSPVRRHSESLAVSV